MLTVIDSSLGNTGSVLRALNYLKAPFSMTKELSEIEKAEKLIFPGVGSYRAASEQILTPEFNQVLRKLALTDKIPILGICLGMQLMTEFGEENGTSKGLGLIRGKTALLRVDTNCHPIPHIGWNDVKTNGLKMFQGIPEHSCFYFVHSYEVMVSDDKTRTATVNYGGVEICAAFEKENIWGAQFHPEKSQSLGLEVLKNFNNL